MKRREFISLIVGAAAAWPLAARAQQTGRVWRVAVIGAVSPLPTYLSAFREALQQRGWTQGKNLSIDVRWPKDSFAQEPGLIPEILHSNVDVIVAWATPTALAARPATSTIPIVFLGISDPVGSGLAAQLVPGMSSVGVVVNPANPGAVAQMGGTQQAVHALGLQSQVVNAATLEEYERVFARLKSDGVNGVLLLQDPFQQCVRGQNCRACAAVPVANGISATGVRGGGRPHVVRNRP